MYLDPRIFLKEVYGYSSSLAIRNLLVGERDVGLLEREIIGFIARRYDVVSGPIEHFSGALARLLLAEFIGKNGGRIDLDALIDSTFLENPEFWGGLKIEYRCAVVQE